MQMVTARNEGAIDKKKLLTERLFMRTCSTSSMESLVRSAMTVKGMVLYLLQVGCSKFKSNYLIAQDFLDTSINRSITEIKDRL